LCPACHQPSDKEPGSTIEIDFRDYFSKQTRELIAEDKLGPHENVSNDELYQKLVEEVDWETRMMWQDEYTAIIRDAIGLYCMAQTVGDPRFVIQQVLQRMHQLPKWLGQRAHRFAVLVKTKGWDVDGFSHSRADVIIITSKLAAAFIDIVSRTLGIIKEQDVSFSNRLADLVIAPGDNGDFTFPLDRIKQSNVIIPFDNFGIALEIDREGKRISEDLSVALQQMRKNARTLPSTCKIATPLCGWGSEVQTPSGITVWNDTRECCLCHICGDSDAGMPDDPPVEDLSGLGRLLPLADGYWVHSSCALWSSEVWETADDGMIHAVEKARSRGAQLKCFGCGFSGATVGCNKSNCPYNYHLPCARACGAAFTTNQQVFCSSHRASAVETLQKESWEHMKTLMVASEKLKSSERDSPDVTESDLCIRVGSLVVHALGSIDSTVDGFHSENYIMPNGFVSSRIFWSSKHPKRRTTYILKIDRNLDGQPEYTIIPGDDPTGKISNSSASMVYTTLMERVRRVNAKYFSQGDMLSKLPVIRRTRRKTYGLNGPQFFGYGLNPVRRLLELIPGIEVVAAPITPTSPQYKFCFSYGPGGSDPTILENLIRDLQRKRAATKAEQATYSNSGCARTEGIKAVVRSGGSGRITRALVRSAEDDTSTTVTKKGDEKIVADRSLVQVKYRKMKSVPIEQRLVARRSHIHGWGLFTKTDIAKHDPVAEYMGEIIRQRVADKREKAYELSGEGSCFMFRLDMNRIIDATKIGCMARFMNHSCQPNAYAKILSIDTDMGQERKIVVFANRDIASGEEITYGT
jgi:histone-lysine N-methyltransferase SETD1